MSNDFFRLPFPLILERGGVLEEVTVAYRTWGRLDASAQNAVLVCDADPWWEPLLGHGRALDPSRDFIVCSHIPDGADFPRLSARDAVAAQRTLIRHFGIRRLRLVLGGSLGGMQALEWAWAAPELVQSVAVIAASGRHLDSYDIARGRGAYERVLASIRQRALIVSPSKREELAMLMPNATLQTIASPLVIDAALVNDALAEWQRTPRRA